MKIFKVFPILSLILGIGIASADVDWQTMTLRSSATDQEAIYDLQKKELYSLQYDESRLVKDFLQTNHEKENELSNLLLHYRSVKRFYRTDGSIEYYYRLPLKEKIMSVLLPNTKPVKLIVPMLCPCCGQEWPTGRSVPEELELIPKQIESAKYTGIIIDCRGFDFNPCLFPTIYNDMLEEFYSTDFANPHHVIDGGLVLYSTQDLYDNPRIGNNPLRIQTTGVFGNRLTNIMIPSIDALRIHGSKDNIKLLEECRLAIIFTP